MDNDAVTDFFTDTLVLGIPLVSWMLAIGAATVSFLVLRFAVSLLRRRLTALASHSESFVGKLAASVAQGTSNGLIFLAAVLIGLNLLDLPPVWLDRIGTLWFAVIVLQVGLWVSRAMSLGMQQYILTHASNQQPGQMSALATIAMWTARVVLWTIVLLAILSNLGVNITAFVASLGVGGIAVALAVQNVLGDLFASLSIAIDKPFEVGDFIVVGSQSGTVEHIGLKTTRIRSLGGEQVVMANASMLSNTIQNFKRLAERRVVFQFGVTYDCTPEQARQIPGIVEGLIRAHEKTRFDRSHFKGFGASSLDFETVYIVLDPGYNLYMDIQQEINLGLMEALAGLGVEFAFPTQTIHVASMPRRPDGEPGAAQEQPPRRPVEPVAA